MKAIIIIISGITLLFALAFGYDMYAGSQFVPVSKNIKAIEKNISLGSVPYFTFKSIDGNDSSIDAFKGRVVIINFWATWCAACITELPDILNTVNKYEGKVVLLAISSDNAREDITRFIAKQSDDIKSILKSEAVHVIFDKNRMITHDLFLTERYPETIIISPNGRMVRKIVGEFDWKSKEIKEYLDTLL